MTGPAKSVQDWKEVRGRMMRARLEDRQESRRAQVRWRLEVRSRNAGQSAASAAGLLTTVVSCQKKLISDNVPQFVA
jgi:hypothetical protein